MKKLLFVISQLYKGGAETSLVNLLNKIDYSKYFVELLILNQEPVKNAVSLIERLNQNVHICNAYVETKRKSLVNSVRSKIFYTEEQRMKYPRAALDFVYGKQYDWAFFVGEWCVPDFVAMEVEAKKKAAWIHSDISRAQYFDDEVYFEYMDKFDYFIFVSQHSMNSSIKKYPFLKEKAVTIYNINDVAHIKSEALKDVDDLKKTEVPMLLTCANFRNEKNHLRQVEVLAELKRRNIECIWVNVGSTADTRLVSRIRQKCKEYQIEDRFLILGPKDNPYKYIRMADAVTVLSDHESWSMVITEAKILGKTVISTKTSGALEQIVDKESGLLTDFNVKSIADTIEAFIRDGKLRSVIEENVKNFDNTSEILESFYELLESKNEYDPDILYVIDDVNYRGGAHAATKLQIQELVQNGRNVKVFSSSIPSVRIRQELLGVEFVSLRDIDEDRLYKRRLTSCLFDRNMSTEDKKRKARYTTKGYRKKLDYDKDILSHVSDEFSKYPVVCVMSEASVYRKMVAESAAEKKIQWIHTDYAGWRDHSDWTRKITEKDGDIYQKFDKIVVLTKGIGERFANIYPHLSSKLVVNHNLIPITQIKKKAMPPSLKNEKPVHFITVGRLESEKEYPRLISILKELKEEGYRFTWTIVGGGSEFNTIKFLIQKSDLEKEVIMTGSLDNPFRKVMEADVFALLSNYEGLPNTIYEALILGVPVLATNVGGISDQITNGKTGWLVDNDEKYIAEKICDLLMNQDQIADVRSNLKNYTYDNEQVKVINKSLFSK